MASWLDRPAARALALLIFLACLAMLGQVLRDDLMPVSADGESAVDDPVKACTAARFSDIDKMVAEAVIDGAQAESFKQRALAMCQATEGQGG